MVNNNNYIKDWNLFKTTVWKICKRASSEPKAINTQGNSYLTCAVICTT